MGSATCVSWWEGSWGRRAQRGEKWLSHSPEWERKFLFSLEHEGGERRIQTAALGTGQQEREMEWNSYRMSVRRKKKVTETKGKRCTFLGGNLLREEDSVSWGRPWGDDLGEVRERVALGYTEGSGTAGLGNVEPEGQELASVEVWLPASFSIHKLRALMQKWHTLLVLSGDFLFFLYGILTY